MSQEDKQLAQDIWDIAHRGEGRGKRFHTVSGKVVAGSIDMQEYTCSVVLSTDDDESDPLTDVMLNAVTMNGLGLLLLPDDGSDVWVSEVDGEGKYGIVKCSTIKQLLVTVGSTKLSLADQLAQFNDGGNGGLMKVAPSVQEWQTIQNDINSWKTILQTLATTISSGGIVTSAVGSPDAFAAAFGAAITDYATQTLTLTNRDNIENTKVKH